MGALSSGLMGALSSLDGSIACLMGALSPGLMGALSLLDGSIELWMDGE